MQGPSADPGVVAAIKRIDRDLSVEWIDPPGRFGIFHKLQIPGRPDEVADRTAAELQQTAALYGYLLDRSECALAAAQALRDAQLVCYVAEEDGGYRPLDHRVVEKLQRMDFYRRNLGLRDWTALVKAKADAAREVRLREQGDVWDVIKKDRVLGRVLSDILWGTPVTRSVHIRRNDADSQLRPEAAPSAGTGSHADDLRREIRNEVAPAERDAPASDTSHAA